MDIHWLAFSLFVRADNVTTGGPSQPALLDLYNSQDDWNRTRVAEEPQQVLLSWGSDGKTFRVQFTTMISVNSVLLKYWRKDVNQAAILVTESKKSKEFTTTKLQALQKMDLFGVIYLDFTRTTMSASPFLLWQTWLGLANAVARPSILRAVASHQYDFLTVLGDQGYNLEDFDGVKGDQYMNFVEPIYANVPVLTTVGNHEVAYNFSHYKNRFDLLPYRDSDFENPMLYSLNYKSLHLVSISTEVYFNTSIEEIKTAQNWIVGDLERARMDRKTRWIIVIGHRPLYCTPLEDPDCSTRGQVLRDALEDIFLQYGVDLYLCGHKHNYQRTYPLAQNQVQSYSYFNPRSFFQVISGNAGNYEGVDPVAGSKQEPEWLASRYEGYGFSTINVSPSRLEVLHWTSALDGSAHLMDRTQVVKPTIFMKDLLINALHPSFQPAASKMALFANAQDIKVHTDRPTPKLASYNFIASARTSEALAQSGHLALSASSQIAGRFQLLKSFVHPHLCQYIEVHRGKHDRIFVVSEYHDYSLQKARNKDRQPMSVLRQWAVEIFSALDYLQSNDVYYAALAPHNVLLDAKNRIKLFRYGMYYMTGKGTDVEFPIGYPPYMAPETLFENMQYDEKSLVTMAEWATEQDNIWNHEDIGSLDINETVLRFLQGNFEDGVDAEEVKAFHKFIISLLQPSIRRRFSVRQALSSSFLSGQIVDSGWVQAPILACDTLDHAENGNNNNQRKDVLQRLPASQVYYLWRLAGGDVELDLVKRGVFLSTPVIERLPRVCFTDTNEIGSSAMDTAQLYSDAVYVLSFKELYQRLEEGRPNSDRFEWDTDYFMVVDENDVNFLLDNGDNTADSNATDEDDTSDDFLYADDIASANPPAANAFSPLTTPTTPSTSRSLNRTLSLSGMSRSASASSLSLGSPTPSTPTQSNNSKLPLFLREQDINYQYHRQMLFSELLWQYPASRKEILHHAKVDIPPFLRGKVWAAVLGVGGDIEYQYDQVDKHNDTETDRQIEVGKGDVPRCHQYNQLLASSVGHEKLRKLLKAWVSANSNLVYWQGLDSLCAPFLTLNFNDEAIAFACLQKFIPRFLNKFFLSDNTSVLQEYLAIFRHLLSYHDPALSSHLETIKFMPDLYAIPWFLTLFTHVFPLDKIYHLWDKIVVGPTSLPLFAGIAILRQIREVLLTYEFDDCITLFSESFPKVDIEKCVQSAMAMCKVTPPSLSARVHDQDTGLEKVYRWWEEPVPIEVKKKELAPRLGVQDISRILPYTLVLDIRSEQEFARGHVPSSMSVQAGQLDSYTNVLRKLNRKYHIVVTERNQQQLGADYTGQLIHKGFPRVALLQGGVEAIVAEQPQFYCSCRPQKQTTAGFKGKGSEPPFVLWRCKTPTPLKKK
ncbi:hypothetical protein EC973_002673 [Apophysomyces ossiformis]|uniref:Acid phosphatase n=1 Tax=Apophysomyces ossiformis TaxID=679940 RepID=A0A8H7ENH9_9FUNG|nr:hypothetical protein EC973_002673 [Apophysomyces ossiformis]